MESPARLRVMSRSGRRVMSTRRVGRSTSSFIRSSRLLPPARYLACGMADRAAVAEAASDARTYSNGRMAVLLPGRGQLRFGGEAPGLGGLAARMDLLDGGDDARVGTAAADVAAHALLDLVVRQARRGLADVLGDVADLAALG